MKSDIKNRLKAVYAIMLVIFMVCNSSCSKEHDNSNTTATSDTLTEENSSNDTSLQGSETGDTSTDTSSVSDNEVTGGADTTDNVTEDSAQTTTQGSQDSTQESTTQFIAPQSTVTTAPLTTPESTTQYIAPHSSASTTKPTTTKAPVTTKKPSTTNPVTPPKATTAQPRDIKTVNVSADRVIVYGVNSDNDSTVKIYEANGSLLRTEKAVGPYFYVEVSIASGSKNIYISATATNKNESSKVSVKISYQNGVSTTVFGGKNSKLYFTDTLDFYLGNKQTNDQYLAYAKSVLEARVKKVQQATGKNTKIIYVICPNPITIYHDLQYSYIGNRTNQTAASQFVNYMKGNNNILVTDLYTVLKNHKSELLFHQTDTHWTDLGAYYGYSEMMKFVKKYSSNAKSYAYSSFTVENTWNPGGDLAYFAGLTGSYEYIPFFTPKFSDMGDYFKILRSKGIRTGTSFADFPMDSYLSDKTLPTAYLIGDSYGAAFIPFVGTSFSRVHTNNGLLWNYTYDWNYISTNKPDYIIHVCTDRNIQPDLAFLIQE